MLEESKYNNNKLEKNSDQESINDYQSTPSSKDHGLFIHVTHNLYIKV